MVQLIVRGFLRRPSLSDTPTVMFCSVHIRNVVAKIRDSSTDLLQRLYGCMKQHNVDFIGGDFNMSAFSTVGDVVSDPEFSAPGNSLLWGLGALEEENRERTGFLIMPKRSGVSIHMAATISTMQRLASDLVRTTNLPGSDSITRSEQAQQRRLERKVNRQRDDVDDRDVINQDHVERLPFHIFCGKQ